ncbi:unnamed protein product [Dibothriocephalus latus]|uniref:Uncharacterized protein n=1 Tax=Dibothriocephalus latus TaxID=60516 RepID=A0A3P7R3I7_DIBLA|nr:unnamed protein product [Dibothriocephalus latus]
MALGAAARRIAFTGIAMVTMMVTAASTVSSAMTLVMPMLRRGE